jgi:hypothetical protein
MQPNLLPLFVPTEDLHAPATQCNYVEALWNVVANLFNLPNYDVLNAAGDPIQWVQSLSGSGSKRERRRKVGILFTFWRQLWKERNQRIFVDEELSVSRVASLIQDRVQALSSALGSPSL